MDKRMSGDSGVVAVVTALLVVLVLLPVAALGLTAYTRTGVAAELQRAADSGALAGAASLALLDVGSTAGSPVDPVALPAAWSALLGPAGRSCAAARTAYGQSGPDDASRTPERNSPLAASFARDVACDAVYSPDPALASCLTTVTAQVDALVGQVADRLLTFLAALDALPAVVVPATPLTPEVVVDPGGLLLVRVDELDDVALAVQQLAPALTRNGVAVQLGYTVQGPLDQVFPGQTPTASRADATARRQFKPLLPSLPALASLADDVPAAAPLSSLLSTTASGLSPLEELVVAQAQLLLQALRLLADPAGPSVSGPDVLAPYVNNTLDVAQASATALLGTLDSTLASAVAPLLAAVGAPATVPPSLSAVPPACLPAVQELVDDLTDALTIRRDTDMDPVRCLVQVVLGSPDAVSLLSSAVPTTQDCVNRVFRAQLAK